jgi:hypothetical protein
MQQGVEFPSLLPLGKTIGVFMLYLYFLQFTICFRVPFIISRHSTLHSLSMRLASPAPHISHKLGPKGELYLYYYVSTSSAITYSFYVNSSALQNRKETTY